MPRHEKPPSFQFYPRDLLSSTAWTAMTPAQRGGYISLLCHAWLQPRQGWLPDDDGLLASLSGLAERWAEDRSAIARAFSVRKGWWVQPRMIRERKAQRRRHFQATKGARATNEKRWSNVAQRSDSESSRVTPASASASVEAKTQEKEEARKSLPHTNGHITAACLGRMRARFPKLDLPIVEAKLLAYHAEHPYRNLDRAFVGWCKGADKRGIDRIEDPDDAEWRP